MHAIINIVFNFFPANIDHIVTITVKMGEWAIHACEF